jgi:hypothetical protein
VITEGYKVSPSKEKERESVVKETLEARKSLYTINGGNTRKRENRGEALLLVRLGVKHKTLKKKEGGA